MSASTTSGHVRAIFINSLEQVKARLHIACQRSARHDGVSLSLSLYVSLILSLYLSIYPSIHLSFSLSRSLSRTLSLSLFVPPHARFRSFSCNPCPCDLPHSPLILAFPERVSVGSAARGSKMAEISRRKKTLRRIDQTKEECASHNSLFSLSPFLFSLFTSLCLIHTHQC